MSAFQFSPSKKRHVDAMKEVELLAGVAVSLQVSNELANMDQWSKEFKEKSFPSVSHFFFSRLGIASFMSISDFKARCVPVFQALNTNPVHIPSSVSDCLDYIKDNSDLISPSNVWQIKIAKLQISTRLSALRTALKKSQLAKGQFNLATAVEALYAADPQTILGSVEICEWEIITVRLVAFAKVIQTQSFAEKDFWDYMSVLLAQFKGMSETEIMDFQTALELLMTLTMNLLGKQWNCVGTNGGGMLY
ncbi:hypothetical protein BJ741DRAFT_713908 [Chytriomyces cf. hyalinus JEL632]|nr:hypothetical protein BJ741DRAFT_713908 [Chytriomyces cf. hyalinus JEL632]